MPNWCKGTLKARGEYDNLKSFLENALDECRYYGEPPEGPLLEVTEETPEYADITLQYADITLQYADITLHRMAHLKDTSRGFVEDTYFLLQKKAGKQIIFLEAKFAWDMKTEELQWLSREYGVDLKITAFERGAQFERDIEIVQGFISLDSVKEYQDYEWMCPCPTMGG